jgi:phage internal scaffolding protein
MKVFLRTGYNYDVDAASLESGLACKDPSLAVESFADEADINNIVNRFLKTGELPANFRAPTYQDFEGVFDFQTAMNAVRQAADAFMQLPASVRSRFGNDPQQFVEFCSDTENLEEARKLGLTIPQPSRAGVTPAAASEAAGAGSGESSAVSGGEAKPVS